MGVDEIHIGKNQKFLTVVCNLETGEPLWFGREGKKETLDAFFKEELSARQRRGIEAAYVEMWEPFRLSIEQWAPSCRIVYDKFQILQHANAAIDEVRRAEFFRKGRRMRGLVKGKRWLLLSRWVNLMAGKRQELNQLFALSQKVFKAYLLKESLDRLSSYRYEGAMLNYLQRGSGGSREWEYQVTAASRAWIQEPALPAAEGPAHSGDQDRIRGVQESSLKRAPSIPVSEPYFPAADSSGLKTPLDTSSLSRPRLTAGPKKTHPAWNRSYAPIARLPHFSI